MAAPNIASITTITGKTIGVGIGTTATVGILTCPSNKVLKINSINVANIDGTSSADVSVSFYDSSATTAYKLAHTITVPADASLIVVGKDNQIYLEESDEIRAQASAINDLDIVVSYEEVS